MNIGCNQHKNINIKTHRIAEKTCVQYITVASQLGFNVNDAIVIDAVDDVNDVVGVDDVVVVDVHLH